ncbi:cupin domain-containing protein [Labrys monachus]|uniref:Cupin superfamily protein n=1 Tax=Labrys monachus TaxID=217067 RepID=A0ABU0FEF8_9HYPH|nr:cupin domain-containing protein [Labrys monachus]MDQ0392992.1 putative cupin superfamily protein [Labrys monachus]
MGGKILNLDDLDFMEFGHGVAYPGAGDADESYQARIGMIGTRVGARQLGCNLTVVPAGRRAFPFHSHRANEEMFFVLEGRGEVTIGDESFPIRQGDVISCPAGGPETAHQIVNTSDADLKYLAVSTKISPEVCDYPRTGRFGVSVEQPPGAKGEPNAFRFMGRARDSLPYWEGE